MKADFWFWVQVVVAVQIIVVLGIFSAVVGSALAMHFLSLFM